MKKVRIIILESAVTLEKLKKLIAEAEEVRIGASDTISIKQDLVLTISAPESIRLLEDSLNFLPEKEAYHGKRAGKKTYRHEPQGNYRTHLACSNFRNALHSSPRIFYARRQGKDARRTS